MLIKGLVSLVGLVAVMGALLFGAAGTVDYWQGWLFLACYALASSFVTWWLVRYDPALLERRMRGGPFAEGERSQKIIMTITSAGFVALLVIPGLDHRFGWSNMPDAVAVMGDALMIAGWLGIFAVFRANSFAAATIQVATDQKVISTGPYALVRHPMYAAALLMLLGITLALASWWGVVAWLGLLPALAWRLLDEERLLVRDLDGYADYRGRVRFRLIPYVW
jgi:protein-S-isoprenylcysteine O-methyltransferase Ste14